MNKLLLILTLSLFGLSFADQANLDQLELEFVNKHFVLGPKLKASSFRNRAIKSLGSLATGTILFALLNELTGAISHSITTTNTRTRSSTFSSDSSDVTRCLNVNYERVALVVSISLATSTFVYKKIHDFILSKLEQQELKKIIENWASINGQVDIQFRHLLNSIYIKYKYNPSGIDYAKAAKDLNSLINKDEPYTQTTGIETIIKSIFFYKMELKT